MAHPNFSGVWELASAEGFDKLKEFAAGLGEQEKTMETALMSLQASKREITQDGDNFAVKLHVADKVEEVNFTIGKEFTKELQGGGSFKALPAWEGDKIVLNITRKMGVNEIHLKVIRELVSPTEISMGLEMGDIKCKAVYKKTG